MTKPASKAMQFEKAPLWSRKTNVSYTLGKEKREKILLKNATVWDVVRHLVVKYDFQVTMVLAFGCGVVLGFLI